MIKSIFRFFLAVVSGVNPRSAWYFRNIHEGRRYDLLRQLEITKSEIVLRTTNNTISIKAARAYSQYLTHLHELLNYKGFKEENGKLTFSTNIDGNSLKFQFTNYGNIFAFKEIFEDTIYQIEFPLSAPTVVIDVGMNIGLASLYFASRPDVVKVYGFELIPSTFDLAKKNIASNSWAAGKCEPYNIGWSNADSEVLVQDNYEGSVTVSLGELVNRDFQNGRGVSVKNASNVVKSIFEKHSHERFILKLDCEGAEYDIVESLAGSELLNIFESIIIEWHYRGAQQLTNYLLMTGFRIASFTTKESGGSTGLIYAFKQ